MSDQNLPALYGPHQITSEEWRRAEAFATVMAGDSTFGVRLGTAVVKTVFCLENRLPLSTALKIAVVKGNMVIPSSVIASLLRSHPLYDYRVVQLDNLGCTVAIMRRDTPTVEWREEGRASFTMQDARQADLADKDVWQKYPQDMMFNRALARAQRRFAPDLFSITVYTPGELSGGTIDAEFAEVKDDESDPPLPLTQEEREALEEFTPENLDDIIAHFGIARFAELSERYELRTFEQWLFFLQHLDQLDEIEWLRSQDAKNRPS